MKRIDISTLATRCMGKLALLFAIAVIGSSLCLAANNGDTITNVYGITDYANGGTQYSVAIQFKTHPNPTLSSPDPWEVTTSTSHKVPYDKIYGSDFTTTDKANIDADYNEYAGELVDSNTPSAAYNQWSYALGKTEFWIYYIDDFLADDYTQVSSSSSADVIVYLRNHDVEYAAVPSTESRVWKREWMGIYRMTDAEISNTFYTLSKKYYVKN